MRQARVAPAFVPVVGTRARLAALYVVLIVAAIALPEAGAVPALLAFLPCAVLAALVVEKP